MTRNFQEYLGDGVYVDFDGVYIWLRTHREVEHKIALDRETLVAFEQYLARLRAAQSTGDA